MNVVSTPTISRSDFRKVGSGRAIVLIPGLASDPASLWSDFAEFLRAAPHLADWDICGLGYTQSFRSATVFAPSFEERSEAIYRELTGVEFAEYRQLAFVTFEDGGLIAQLALLDHQDLAGRIHTAFFLAPLNGGFHLSTLFHLALRVSRVFSLGFLSVWGKLFAPLDQLLPGSSFLAELRERWNRQFGAEPPFNYWAIAAEDDELVSIESLSIFPTNHLLVVPGNHSSLVKPGTSANSSAQIVLDYLHEHIMPQAAPQLLTHIAALRSKADAGEFDILLVHSDSDREVVHQISERLKQSGVRTWLDEEQVLPGHNWAETLLGSIDHIKAVAFCIGKNKPGTQDERERNLLVQEFTKRGVPIVPVFLPDMPLDGTTLPDLMAAFQPVYLNKELKVDRMIAALPRPQQAVKLAPVFKTAGVSAQPLKEVVNRRRYKRIAIAAGILGSLFVLVALTPAAFRAYEFYLDAGFTDQAPIAHPERRNSHYVRNENRERVLVFVHGIFGDADGTWTAPPEIYWPDLIKGDPDFANADIYVVQYETGAGNRMGADRIAGNLEHIFKDAKIFENHHEVIFVCHSLGGLIIQRLLLINREHAAHVPLIYFYATPQTGSQIARLGKIFSSNPLLREMAPDDSNSYLDGLENEWRHAKFSIHRLCAFEKFNYRGVLVVSENSGTRMCDSDEALNKNHASIVKPVARNDLPYVLLKNAWQDLPKAQESKSTHNSASKVHLAR